MRLPWTQLSASPRTVFFRWNSVIDHIDHAGAESTTAVDDGEAEEGDDVESGKTRQWMPTRRGVRGFTGSAALPSPQNNRGCG